MYVLLLTMSLMTFHPLRMQGLGFAPFIDCSVWMRVMMCCNTNRILSSNTLAKYLVNSLINSKKVGYCTLSINEITAATISSIMG